MKRTFSGHLANVYGCTFVDSNATLSVCAKTPVACLAVHERVFNELAEVE